MAVHIGRHATLSVNIAGPGEAPVWKEFAVAKPASRRVPAAPLDHVCQELLVAVLRDDCPIGILADALEERGDPRGSLVRAAELRAGVADDVNELARALHRKDKGRNPGPKFGPIWEKYHKRAEAILAGSLLRFAYEYDVLRSETRRRLVVAIGGGSESIGSVYLGHANIDATSYHAGLRMVREDSR